MIETLCAGLERAARDPATGIRLLDRNERETWLAWPDLAARSRSVAGRLAAAGVAPGDRVALVYPTGPEFLEAFFGTLLAGAVPTPLYPPLRLGRLGEYHRRTAALLDAIGPALVLTETRVRRLLGETIERAAPPLGGRTLEELPAAAPTAREVGPGDLALIQFSSGTTEQPKPVALTHAALWRHAAMLNAYWPDRDGRRHSGVSWLPLYHDMGLIGCVLAALERVATLTLLPPEAFLARPALWLRAVSRYRATVSPAPDFGYALATERIRDEELDGVDLSSWEVALDGAETVAAATLERFAERFAPWGFRRRALTPVYGLSEAALAVTFSRPEEPPLCKRFDRAELAAGRAVPAAAGRELVCLGRPVPGVRLRIRGDDGATLPERSVGGLQVASPTLMQGYFGRPEATAAVLRDGWLDTGDLGFLDDGALYLVGRAKEILIVRGRNIAPEELERVAWSVPGARPGCAAAVGEAVERAPGERIVLLVERRRGSAEGSDRDLAEACRDAVLAATGVEVEEVVILAPGTLPRTSSGKIRRRQALRLHRAGELEPPAPVTPWRLLAAVVRSWRARRRLEERPEGG